MINSFLAEAVKTSVARLTNWARASRPARRARRASIAVEQIEDRCVPATLNLTVQVGTYTPEPELPPGDSEVIDGEFSILPAEDGVVIECWMPIDPLPDVEMVVPPEDISHPLGQHVIPTPADGSRASFTFDVPDEIAALGWVRMDLYLSADDILDDQDVLLSSEGTFTWQDENGDYHGEFYPYVGAGDVEGQNLIAVFTAESARSGPIYTLDGANPEAWMYMTGVGGEEEPMMEAFSGPRGRGGKNHRTNDENGPRKTRRNERRNRRDNDRPGRRNNLQIDTEEGGRRRRNGGKPKVSGDAAGTRLADPSLGMIWWDGSAGDAPWYTGSDTDIDDTPGDDGEVFDTEVFDEIAE